MKLLGWTILVGTFFALVYFAGVRPERQPLLIQAAWQPNKDWCDVTYSPRPLLNPPSRQWSRKADRT